MSGARAEKRLLLSYDAMRARRNVLCFVAYSIAPLLAAVRVNLPLAQDDSRISMTPCGS